MRGAETHFDTIIFFMPHPVLKGDVFKHNDKLWEVKGVIYHPGPGSLDPQKERFDEDKYLSELTVESFPIV